MRRDKSERKAWMMYIFKSKNKKAIRLAEAKNYKIKQLKKIHNLILVLTQG